MGHRSEFIGREGPKSSSPFVWQCNTLVVHSIPSEIWSGSRATQNFLRDAWHHVTNLAVTRAGTPCCHACRRQNDVRIQWFDDPTVGMRYSGREAEVTADYIRRLAAEFDPPPPKNPSSKGRRFGLTYRSDRNATGSRATVFRTAFVAGAQRRRTALVDSRATRGRPPIEGEMTELTPSRTKSQEHGTRETDVNNQNDETVLTFIPTVIVLGVRSIRESPKTRLHEQAAFPPTLLDSARTAFGKVSCRGWRQYPALMREVRSQRDCKPNASSHSGAPRTQPLTKPATAGQVCLARSHAAAARPSLLPNKNSPMSIMKTNYACGHHCGSWRHPY
jgi:hypothetical protein